MESPLARNFNEEIWKSTGTDYGRYVLANVINVNLYLPIHMRKEIAVVTSIGFLFF